MPLRMQFQTLELTAHSCEEEEGVKTLGEWVKEATAWVDDKCLDWTGGYLQKHLAHACTCLQKYCTKLNISIAICKTSFIMRRGFDICNTFANLCPLCPCKIGLRGEREWTVLGLGAIHK